MAYFIILNQISLHVADLEVSFLYLVVKCCWLQSCKNKIQNFGHESEHMCSFTTRANHRTKATNQSSYSRRTEMPNTGWSQVLFWCAAPSGGFTHFRKFKIGMICFSTWLVRRFPDHEWCKDFASLDKFLLCKVNIESREQTLE